MEVLFKSKEEQDTTMAESSKNSKYYDRWSQEYKRKHYVAHTYSIVNYFI